MYGLSWPERHFIPLHFTLHLYCISVTNQNFLVLYLTAWTEAPFGCKWTFTVAIETHILYSGDRTILSTVLCLTNKNTIIIINNHKLGDNAAKCMHLSNKTTQTLLISYPAKRWPERHLNLPTSKNHLLPFPCQRQLLGVVFNNMDNSTFLAAHEYLQWVKTPLWLSYNIEIKTFYPENISHVVWLKITLNSAIN